MEKKVYKKSSPELTKLRASVEESINLKVRTPSDFTRLSELILEKTNELLSPTTLKRLWGYIEGADTTRLSTLNILARFLGFNHWEEYESQISNGKPPECIIGKGINAKNLEKGDKIALAWNPNRRIVIEYQGDFHFKIIEAENCDLAKDDTFACGLFFLNEPLYVDKLVHIGNEPVAFVMGKKDGLTKMEIMK